MSVNWSVPTAYYRQDKISAFMRQRRWLKVALYLAGWTVAALIFAVQHYLGNGAEAVAIGWRRVITSELGQWYAWAALFPIVYWLARRFPLEVPRLASRLSVHLAAAILVTGLQLCLEAILVWIIRGLSDPLMLIVSRILHMVFWNYSEGFVLYWVMLLACHTLHFQARLRAQELRASRLEAQLAQAQLSALKMQLHPHFLFNTLHSISALLHGDVEAADLMVARLGDFLRLTLENSETQEVTLEQELEFLRCYLDIELIRFQDRLRVKFEIASGTLDALTPNLILQPLVENAIRHGIAPRMEPGCVTIRSELQGNRLRIEVRDDGPGFASNTPGIGLSNTRARLERLYGSGYVLQLSNGAHNGAIVTLEIPFRVSKSVAYETVGTADG
jgi:two-component system LytT family sensor kinase